MKMLVGVIGSKRSYIHNVSSIPKNKNEALSPINKLVGCTIMIGKKDWLSDPIFRSARGIYLGS